LKIAIWALICSGEHFLVESKKRTRVKRRLDPLNKPATKGQKRHWTQHAKMAYKGIKGLTTTRHNPTNGTKQGQKAWGRSERLADGMGHESAHKWLILCEPYKNPIHPSQRETTNEPQRGHGIRNHEIAQSHEDTVQTASGKS